jgi:Nif-specific regulatory protein
MKYNKELGKSIKTISNAVLEAFLSHSWPGNVRELENCIERAVLLATGSSIETVHLPPSLQTRSREGERKESGKLNAMIEAQERGMIVDALKESRGNQSQAARILGTTKRIIQYKIQKLGIDPRRFKAKYASPSSPRD